MSGCTESSRWDILSGGRGPRVARGMRGQVLNPVLLSDRGGWGTLSGGRGP